MDKPMTFIEWCASKGVIPYSLGIEAAYEAGQQSQQSKVEELQNDVSIMLNSHKRMSVGLLQQQSMIEELIKDRDELQKRVDAVIIEIENMYLSGAISFDTVKKLEQALKGE